MERESEQAGDGVPAGRALVPVAVKRRAPRKRKRKAPARWSERRVKAFLAELAQCSNVAQSARAAGLSDSVFYRRRALDADFRARWAAALNEGVAKLETMLLDRALNGVERPVWHGGKQVGTMREYSDRLALALLTAHRGRQAGGEAAGDADAVRADLALRLADMNRAMGGEG